MTRSLPTGFLLVRIVESIPRTSSEHVLPPSHTPPFTHCSTEVHSFPHLSSPVILRVVERTINFGGRPASTQAFLALLLLSQVCFRVGSFCFLCLTCGRVCLVASTRNILGLKFSRMSLAETLRDLIFEDCPQCVRARRRLTSHAQSAKTAKILILENF